ncbi:hypothetical protein [Mycobacterium hubeiense]|uniref:hypothetical protein n=1 Tax=Mycobacterium hubeiense TaxID=1867256 RepID=UPI0018EB4273|nr:hypothetical protein [Mycobacterium sp. QGD 101]
MKQWVRRILGHKVSVETMIETAMWLAVPYLVIGMTVAFFHPEHIRAIETQLQVQLPAGANLIALGETIVLWPVLLFAPALCPVPG